VDGIQSALDRIHRGLRGDLRLERLAEHSGLSASRFHRVFRDRVGEPPCRYVRRMRLEAAARWLKVGGVPVTDVAFAVGYETHEAFTRAFKARFGLPPREFRERHSAPASSRVEPRLEAHDGRRVAVTPHVGAYARTWDTFIGLRDWADARGVPRDASPITFYFDDQSITAPRHTRAEVGIEVDESVAADPSADVRIREISGEFAVFSFPSPYPVHQVHRAYDYLYRCWLPARGRTARAAPTFEQYPAAGVVDGVTTMYAPIAPLH